MNIKEIEQLIEKMTLDELVGQVLNFDLSFPDFPIEELEDLCAEVHPGSLFVDGGSQVMKHLTDKERNRYYADIANKHAPVPTIFCTDGHIDTIKDYFSLMAWGAVDDPELIESFGRAYAAEMRDNGEHIFLGPVADISVNKDNPITSTRAVSDSAEHVKKIDGAYVRGLTSNDGVIACCKHFPGDGMDDRNQHYCTTINSCGKQEWMDTYGAVYKEMFKNGAKAVMCAHISLPSWQPEEECLPITGYLPGSLSKTLMTDLLKGELGFDGCIISDAMNMIGAVAVCPREELGVRFIEAGGDMMLFAQKIDFYEIRKAIQSGRISMERIKDAVKRVLILKNTVGLLDGREYKKPEGLPTLNEIIEKASKRSFVIERNFDDILPLDIKQGGKILVINMQPERQVHRKADAFDAFAQTLTEKGFTVDVKMTPFVHLELMGADKEYECIIVISAYVAGLGSGGTLRMGADHMGPFWDGVGLRHPKMIYVSLGDPYKLYEHPFLHTYVNGFTGGYYSQRALAGLLLGEIEPLGKNPVELKGFFKRDVQ